MVGSEYFYLIFILFYGCYLGFYIGNETSSTIFFYKNLGSALYELNEEKLY